MAGRLGLTSREVVDNVITALTSNAMILPNYWDDPKSGNSYELAVQYPESQIKSLQDLEQIPIKSPDGAIATYLGAVVQITRTKAPTEVDHYQLRRSFDIYVMPKKEDLSRVSAEVNHVLAGMHHSANITVDVGGAVENMQDSFKSFGIGLILAIVLVYLILMAQFASFSDPFIILLAVPPGFSGVVLILLATGTT